MKGFTAFFIKELREMIRTKRMMIILGIFLVVGILSPAMAKLTPELMKMAAEDFTEMGVTVGEIKVTALDSWAQFTKNMPTALIVVIIMMSGIYTSEYARGTLVPLITKGLSRQAVVLSKLAVMLITWSAGAWLCYGVTYFYTEWYWDNKTAKAPVFGAFCIWLFGVLMISCIVFFSSLASSGAQVMLGTGAVYIAMTMAGLYSKAKEYLPTRLLDSNPLYRGELLPGDYTKAAVISAAVSAVLILAALPITKRRMI